MARRPSNNVHMPDNPRSLRTYTDADRPTFAPSFAAPPGQTPASPPLDSAKPPQARRGSDKIGAALLKKRQSVLVSGPASYTPKKDAPPMPSLPSDTSARRGAVEIEKAPLRPGELDAETLGSEPFDADAFMKKHCANDTSARDQMEAMRNLKEALMQQLDQINHDIQDKVLKNYHEFILVAKEISTLENEMLELKSILDEWKGVPGSLEITSTPDADSPSLTLPRNRNRNSIADLAALYRSQLEALYDSVSGSQKFLPPVRNRHIIAECANFVELQPATYKPRQNVHLFLLNDAMLVAVKKRGQMGGEIKTIADRAYTLSEIVVVDLKDTPDLTNALKIKRGKETSIFRSPKLEDKKMLLGAFKKVAEELMNKRRKESVWEAEARKDGLGIRTSVSNDALHPLSGFSPAKVFGVSRDDPSGKDLSWISDVSDELAVFIATRQFEDAVQLVEKIKSVLPTLSADPMVQSLLRSKSDARTSELIASLLYDLADPAIRKSGVVKTAGWLLRLQAGEQARETLLQSRGRLVSKRTNEVEQGPDLAIYVSEISLVCFTLIKNTCEWYMAAFKDHHMASGFVKWAIEQLDVFASVFKGHVRTAGRSEEEVAKAVDIAKAHASMLKEVGLDFNFMLDQSIR